MGPLPTMRIVSRSSRRGMRLLRSRHQTRERVEEVRRVVRPGPRLGVVLDPERGRVEHAEALDDTVVQVHVRDRRAAQRVEVDGVVVVLAGDLHPARRLATHRMVGAVVPEPQLERLGAERAPEDLVTEADAEHGHLAEEAGDGVGRAGLTGTSPRRPATVSAAPATAAGSPGPLDRNTPSGPRASTSAAGVGAGTTSTTQPTAAR